MAAVIEVNTSTLRADVTEIEGEIKKINTQIDALTQTLHELSDMWDGPAKQAFVTAVQDDINTLKSLVQAISGFTNKTSQARTEYEKCENAVGQIVSSLRV